LQGGRRHQELRTGARADRCRRHEGSPLTPPFRQNHPQRPAPVNIIPGAGLSLFSVYFQHLSTSFFILCFYIGFEFKKFQKAQLTLVKIKGVESLDNFFDLVLLFWLID
ncbi:MAG: hypothetical protein K2F91_05450, partial [Muribaculaceae bacterium]|nr:hypothetical protein [Muribaculaceae bacterium]